MSQENSVEAPPTREANTDPNGSLPPNNSLAWRVREAHRSSSGKLHCLQTVSSIILEAIGYTVVVCLTTGIPVSMITIGSIHLHNCPAKPFIPIYLILGGAIGIIQNIFNLYLHWRRRSGKATEKETQFNWILICSFIAFLIAGFMWISLTNEPDYEHTSSTNYCNKTLYTYSFWLTASVMICVGVVTFVEILNSDS